MPVSRRRRRSPTSFAPRPVDPWRAQLLKGHVRPSEQTAPKRGRRRTALPRPQQRGVRSGQSETPPPGAHADRERQRSGSGGASQAAGGTDLPRHGHIPFLLDRFPAEPKRSSWAQRPQRERREDGDQGALPVLGSNPDPGTAPPIPLSQILTDGRMASFPRSSASVNCPNCRFQAERCTRELAACPRPGAATGHSTAGGEPPAVGKGTGAHSHQKARRQMTLTVWAQAGAASPRRSAGRARDSPRR